MGRDSICAYCSRMKRGILYGCCRREGYTCLALAQHLDDLGESFVMSAFNNGRLRTMKVDLHLPTAAYYMAIRDCNCKLTATL